MRQGRVILTICSSTLFPVMVPLIFSTPNARQYIRFLSAKIGVATYITRWYILSPKRKKELQLATSAKPHDPVIDFISDFSCINIACELETKTHRDLDKMPFANLDKHFGVKRKNDDLNEIQNCAKVARTDSSDATLSKCKYMMPGLVFGVKTFLGLTKLIMMDKQELNVIGVKNVGK